MQIQKGNNLNRLPLRKHPEGSPLPCQILLPPQESHPKRNLVASLAHTQKTPMVTCRVTEGCRPECPAKALLVE